jgi:hypothetical protein
MYLCSPTVGGGMRDRKRSPSKTTIGSMASGPMGYATAGMSELRVGNTVVSVQ